MKKEYVAAAAGLLALTIGVNLWAYGQLPAMVASHWGISGQADGFMPRGIVVWFAPVIMAFLGGLFLVMPRIDPNRQAVNYGTKWQVFVVAIIGFLAYINGLMMWWNLGGEFNMVQMLVPALAGILYLAGRMMEGTKRNYFIGFRTPWALDDDEVWKKTNQAGAMMMKLAAGAILIGGLVSPAAAFVVLMTGVIGGSLVVTGYSYLIYRKKHA